MHQNSWKCFFPFIKSIHLHHYHSILIWYLDPYPFFLYTFIFSHGSAYVFLQIFYNLFSVIFSFGLSNFMLLCEADEMKMKMKIDTFRWGISYAMGTLSFFWFCCCTYWIFKAEEKQKTVALNLCYSNLDLYIHYLLLLLYISNRNCCKCAFYFISFYFTLLYLSIYWFQCVNFSFHKLANHSTQQHTA